MGQRSYDDAATPSTAVSDIPPLLTSSSASLSSRCLLLLRMTSIARPISSALLFVFTPLPSEISSRSSESSANLRLMSWRRRCGFEAGRGGRVRGWIGCTEWGAEDVLYRWEMRRDGAGEGMKELGMEAYLLPILLFLHLSGQLLHRRVVKVCRWGV